MKHLVPTLKPVIVSMYLLTVILLISCSPAYLRSPSGDIDDQYRRIPAAFDIPRQFAPPVGASNTGEPTAVQESGLRLAHISDVHHYAKTLYDPGSPTFARFTLNNEGRTVLYSSEILQSLGHSLKSSGVDALLISGDLSVFGIPDSHREVAQVLREIERAGTEVYVTTGNHDINHPRAFRITASGTEPVSSVTADEFRDIYADFGFDQAIMMDEDSLSYLALLGDAFYVLALDSSSYEFNYDHGFSVSGGFMRESQYDFATRALDYVDEHDGKIIVMTHHNFLAHYESDRDLSTFMISDDNRMLDLLIDRGVNFALSGHIHKNDISTISPNGREFTSMATTSLSIYPHGYRILDLAPEGISVESYEVDLAFDAETNERILTHSRFIGFDRSFGNVYRSLLEEHSRKDSLEIAEYFYMANLYAQQGRELELGNRLDAQVLEPLQPSQQMIKAFAPVLILDAPPSDRSTFINWAQR